MNDPKKSLLELAEELENVYQQFKISLDNLRNTIPVVCHGCNTLKTDRVNITTINKFGVCFECKVGNSGGRTA